MEYVNDLARLEGMVEKLVTRVEELGRDKARLIAEVERRDEELAELRRQYNALSEERAEVHQRVSRLLGQLEEWEAAQETGEGQSAAAGEPPAEHEAAAGQQLGLQMGA